jgi:hypothetical protein
VDGFVPQVDLSPERDDGPLARVVVTGRSPPTPAELTLCDAIERRRSNRSPFLDTDVSSAERAALMRAAEHEGAWLSLVIGQVGIELVAAMMRLADRALMAQPEYVAELVRWSRTDPRSVDGVTGAAGGPAPERPPKSTLARQSSAFSSPLPKHGLSASMASQAIDVPAVREQLRIGMRRHGPPQMLLRFGRGPAGVAAGRRPVEEVLLGVGEAAPAAAIRLTRHHCECGGSQ